MQGTFLGASDTTVIKTTKKQAKQANKTQLTNHKNSALSS
jgi:hypothetical protein